MVILQRTIATVLLPFLSTICKSNGFSTISGVSKTNSRRFQGVVPRPHPSEWLLQETQNNAPRTTTTSLSAISPEAVALARTLAPKVGMITSTALYFSPTWSVRNAVKENDMGDLNPLPLALMATTSISWLAYGLSARDNYVALSNIAGCIASVGYVVGILPLLRKKSLRQTQAVVMAGVASLLSLWTYLGVSRAPIAKMSTTLGLFASTLFILLSASPLSTIKTVIARKNSASILGSLTTAQVTNTFLWTVYGLAVKDLFVWGPNAAGLGLGLIQLFLKVVFPSR